MLLHHLPPNAQTDESHQAECLETDGSACLHPAGEPEYSRTGTIKQRMDDRSIVACFLIKVYFNTKMKKTLHLRKYKQFQVCDK